MDPRRGTHLGTLLPVDKERNADRRRRALVDPAVATMPAPAPAPVGIAPLLRQLMAEYAATGLPPAYVPHDSTVDRHDGDDDTDHEHHDPKEHP